VPPEAAAARNLLRVWNKIDRVAPALATAIGEDEDLRVSAHTGAGLDQLCGRIVHLVWGGQPPVADACINERHACLLQRALAELTDAREEAESDRWELAAVALRAALTEVGKVSGKTHTPDILDNIFSRFCIGK
jgi:tRNA modification GTPase